MEQDLMSIALRKTYFIFQLQGGLKGGNIARNEKPIMFMF